MVDGHDLSTRTPMIGRREEIERLNTYLRAPGSERHFVYYWAEGGLGKTRLLEELQYIVKEAGPKFYFSGIIDLYHTDTHSTSDLERSIVEGLDPMREGQAPQYFADYRRERRKFELLRERGPGPNILEQRRKILGDLFVQGCQEMARDAYKLVICFDTVEVLQYESSIIEEKAGLDTADTRIKPWLLDKLAQLTNVLVVFAGRPKQAPGETAGLQEKFIADMKTAFDDDLEVIELKPFTLKEMQDFLDALPGKDKIVTPSHLPVVHHLTGGRPIFLHLLADRMLVLGDEARTIEDLFEEFADLVDVPEDDARVGIAREQMERRILSAVFNDLDEIGGYLKQIALMPKGFDSEILQISPGLPEDEANQLLEYLESLAIIKKFKAPAGGVRLHGEHLFLHDEVYRLLTLRNIIPHMRMNERSVASRLVRNYYNPRIAKLERDLAQSSVEHRVDLREQWQKYQVERIYYLLVYDPRKGYEEYKRLTDQANRRREVGFSMRLLDEFLRFYNAPGRKELFEAVGISYEQIIRESAEMWVERFHWWGQRNREVKFARIVLDQPETFFIDPEKYVAILANICALWARAYTILHRYEPKVVAEASAWLDRLPALAECTPEQALARARLATSIGYQLDEGGLLPQAAVQYVEAKAAFRKFGQYQDELAMLLNNLAYVYAREGRMALARPLAHEALRINERMGFEYSTGRTLSTLSNIAKIRRNYGRAIEYGEDALTIFQGLQDAHGIALAYQAIAQAKRRMAKHELEKGRKLEEARKQMEEALHNLNNALEVAKEAGLSSSSAARQLRVEQALVNRDLGRLVSDLEESQEGLSYYRQGERQLRQILDEGELGRVEHAHALQDLAEILFDSGDPDGAQECLEQIEDLIGPQHRIIPGERKPASDVPREHFSPLGKVEMLRGQMAFAQGKREDGLQRYVIAYAYFMHFSPEAIELETLVEYVYKRLRDLPVEQQSALMKFLLTWVEQHDLGVNVDPFVQTLKDLLGV